MRPSASKADGIATRPQNHMDIVKNIFIDGQTIDQMLPSLFTTNPFQIAVCFFHPIPSLRTAGKFTIIILEHPLYHNRNIFADLLCHCNWFDGAVIWIMKLSHPNSVNQYCVKSICQLHSVLPAHVGVAWQLGSKFGVKIVMISQDVTHLKWMKRKRAELFDQGY